MSGQNGGRFIFWATTVASRRRVIAALPEGLSWHLSWDRFHVKHVKLPHLVAVVEALRAGHAEIIIRIAVEDADDPYPDMVSQALPGVPLAIQPVIAVGRGTPEPFETSEAQPRWPCLSTGPLVMPDGTARPCCSAMIDHPNHPFAARSAQDGLVALHRDWGDDPLLTMLRAVGFGPILHLLGEIAPKHPALAGVSPHPCDLCAAIFEDSSLASAIAKRAHQPAFYHAAQAAARYVFRDGSP